MAGTMSSESEVIVAVLWFVALTDVMELCCVFCTSLGMVAFNYTPDSR